MSDNDILLKFLFDYIMINIIPTLISNPLVGSTECPSGLNLYLEYYMATDKPGERGGAVG